MPPNKVDKVFPKFSETSQNKPPSTQQKKKELLITQKSIRRNKSFPTASLDFHQTPCSHIHKIIGTIKDEIIGAKSKEQWMREEQAIQEEEKKYKYR